MTGEWGEALYAVKEPSPGALLVAKFEGRREPAEVYEVIDRGSSAWRCTCPASKRSTGDCKHARLVRAWRSAGEPPALWADDGGEFAPAARLALD